MKQKILQSFAVLALIPLSQLRAETVALAGDSLVSTVTSGTRQGWGASLNKFVIADLRVSNQAASGRTTQEFIDEGRWGKLLRSKPDFIFVQFGHNDQKPENNVPLKKFQANLARFIDNAHAQGALIYLVTSPHRCRFKNGKATQELKTYVDGMKSVAKNKNVGVIDLHKRTGTWLNSQGTKACKEFYESDTAHLNKKGADKVASFVADEAKRHADLRPFMK